MDFEAAAELVLGDWRISRATGELRGPTGSSRLEPKVAELLFLLASRPGAIFTREEIQQTLWPEVTVGEDSLARLVFKLRRALDDDPKAPRWIATLPKRGYRLLAATPEPSAVVEPAAAAGEPKRPSLPAAPAAPAAGPLSRQGSRLLAALLLLAALVSWRFGPHWERGAASPSPPPSQPPSPPPAGQALAAPAEVAARANDFYFQYSREDNEAAIALFERLVGAQPDYAPAYAGLANALVQRVMRWPTEPPGVVHKNLRSALADGHLRLPAAQRTLERAEALARQAVALAPEDAETHKALGLVRSAREDFPGALAAYHRAVALDADAWGALINIGDVYEIQGNDAEALPYLEAAFAAMTRVYPRQTPRVQPWYAELATGIGDRHLAEGRLGEAESWYRRALEFSPLQPAATRGLARVLVQAGDPRGAASLCRELQERLGTGEPCG